MINKKHLMVAILLLMSITFISFGLGCTEVADLFYKPLLAITIVGVCVEG